MYKILIIEDDPIWQIKLQFMLEEQECGYNIQVASNLNEAQKILESFTTDIIVTDIKLPDGLSFGFFQNHTYKCPILFVTEYAERTFLEQTNLVANSSFYVKPFHALTLVAAIKNAIKTFEEENGALIKVLQVPIRYGQKKDIATSSVCWIEVDGNYSTIRTINERYLWKISLPKIRLELNEHFIQINKWVIVNKEFIERINLKDDIVIVQEQTFEIGRTYRKDFLQSIYTNDLVK